MQPGIYNERKLHVSRKFDKQLMQQIAPCPGAHNVDIARLSRLPQSWFLSRFMIHSLPIIPRPSVIVSLSPPWCFHTEVSYCL
jgi:hypothetical protein